MLVGGLEATALGSTTAAMDFDIEAADHCRMPSENEQAANGRVQAR